jgi:glycerol-3-phosphate O-acyltransferase/dihydroxyacetone phosphate acyltransferase
LAVWSILALPGVVLNGPIFITAKLISRKKQRGLAFDSFRLKAMTDEYLLAEALAKSNVKIQARDVLATWKILISLGLAPILYGFYAFLATVIAMKAGASLKWKILTPIMVITALPFIGVAALKFGEAGMDVLK